MMLMQGQTVTLLNGMTGQIIEVYAYQGNDGGAGRFKHSSGTTFTITIKDVAC